MTQDGVTDSQTRLVDKLVDDQKDILIDCTGKTADKRVEAARKLKGAGYDVAVYETRIPELESVKRGYALANVSGRINGRCRVASSRLA